MRTIIAMIRFLIRVIWSLVWGLFWTLALSFALLVAALFFSGKTGSGIDGVSRAVQMVVTQVDAYFHRDGPLLGQGSPSTQEDLATDGHTSTGARWDQATAKVYLDPEMDETFTRAYEEALESWNQTGAFTFQLVTSEEEADILLTEMDDSRFLQRVRPNLRPMF